MLAKKAEKSYPKVLTHDTTWPKWCVALVDLRLTKRFLGGCLCRDLILLLRAPEMCQFHLRSAASRIVSGSSGLSGPLLSSWYSPGSISAVILAWYLSMDFADAIFMLYRAFVACYTRLLDYVL